MSLSPAIYTLWLREVKRFGRNKSRLIGSMALPVLFLVVLGSGFGGFFRYRNDVRYIEFIGPGIVGMTLLFSAMFGGMNVLWDKQFGFLKEILVAPVSRNVNNDRKNHWDSHHLHGTGVGSVGRNDGSRTCKV